MICKHCGANLTPEEKVCSYCRCYVEELPPPPPPPPAPQDMQIQNVPQNIPTRIVNYLTTTPDKPASKYSKKTAIMLCLLGFFGIGGLHRFYVGKYWTGIFWLLSNFLGYILTIFDLIAIMTNKFEDKDGNILK